MIDKKQINEERFKSIGEMLEDPVKRKILHARTWFPFERSVVYGETEEQWADRKIAQLKGDAMSEGNEGNEGNEEFYLFWGGLFSQWAMIDMEVDNVTYNCCEQYMMAEKARLFDDPDMLEKIMASRNPKDQKMKYGRNIHNFDQDKWEAVAKDIVYKANYAKFTSNSDCLMELARSRGRTIVEASPYDKIWGIGLGVNDPRARDRSQWQGTNWLGEVIMNVRETLDKDGWFDTYE